MSTGFSVAWDFVAIRPSTQSLSQENKKHRTPAEPSPTREVRLDKMWDGESRSLTGMTAIQSESIILANATAHYQISTLIDWSVWGKRIAIASRVVLVLVWISIGVAGYYIWGKLKSDWHSLSLAFQETTNQQVAPSAPTTPSSAQNQRLKAAVPPPRSTAHKKPSDSGQQAVPSPHPPANLRESNLAYCTDGYSNSAGGLARQKELAEPPARRNGKIRSSTIVW
jgi:hypothetical protein